MHASRSIPDSSGFLGRGGHSHAPSRSSSSVIHSEQAEQSGKEGRGEKVDAAVDCREDQYANATTQAICPFSKPIHAGPTAELSSSKMVYSNGL